MNDDTKDRLLREASSQLTQAMRTLHEAGFYDLSDRALRLANHLLQQRRELKSGGFPVR